MNKLIVAALAAAFLPSATSAAVIDLDTLVGWHIQNPLGTAPFFFDDVYTTSVGQSVRVTDLFVWGDEYNYYINDVFVGSILAPTPPADFDDDPDSAFASGLFASAVIELGAGDVLKFESITIPDGFVDATIAVSVGGAPAIPEPATWAMMIAGFGLVGTALRRRAVARATA